MAEHFVVRIDNEATHAQWCVVDSRGHLAGPVGAGTLHEAAQFVMGRRVVLLVPGSEVLLIETQLPSGSRGKLLKLAPYALEEQLAEDVEQLAFAVGEQRSDGSALVATTDAGQLSGWLSAVKEAGLNPQAAHADSEGLPTVPGTSVVLVEGERVMLRPAVSAPVVFETQSLEELWDLLPEDEQKAHTQLYVAGADSSDGWDWLRERTQSLQVHALPQGAMPRLAATVVAEKPINLLQGPLAPKSDWQAWVRPWRAAAMLAAGLVVVSTVGQALELWSLSRQAAALEARVDSACRSALPGVNRSRCGPTADARLAVAPGTDRALPEFLVTLAAVGEGLKGEAQFEAVSFRNGVLDLRVIVPNVNLLEQLKTNLGSRFSVEIQSANPTEGGIEGRVQVRST